MLGKEFPSNDEHEQLGGGADQGNYEEPVANQLNIPHPVLVLSQVRGFPKYTASNTTTAINFFGFPTEIRLKIYSELLVHSEPIVFVADYGPSSPPLFRSKRDGLCPALLCVNKRAHSEASPLLYSNNRFRFPDIFTSSPSATDSAHIAPFLSQIGSQASLIRHICILKIWNSSEIPVQASLLSNYCSVTH
jgi:hypothetical protein